MSDVSAFFEQQVPLLIGGAVLIAVTFLIARVLRLPQRTALALALAPMAFAAAFDRAILPALQSIS